MMDISSTANGMQRELYYPSLDALRAAHNGLLQRYHRTSDAETILDEVVEFVEHGRSVGAVLDDLTARSAAQSILDYWSTILFRSGHWDADATLDEFDPLLAPDLPDDPCPYVGLDAFSEERQELFFGRQRVVEAVISRIGTNRLVSVVGPSGSGKSSLVLAGVVPMLRHGALPGSADWRYLPRMVPGSAPLANLARLLASVRGDADPDPEAWAQEHVKRLRQNPAHLAELANATGEAPVVIVIDQFEEVFTLGTDERERQAFVAALMQLVQVDGPRHTCILTIRADFESRVPSLLDFQPLFEQALVRVTPLTASELREAIEKPADLIGLKFESGLIEQLVQDVLGEPAALPLLQFTLLKLWENRERNRITWEAYRRLGGAQLGGARRVLWRTADALYERLIPEDQVTARRIFQRLVQPGEALEFTSRRVRLADLHRASDAPDRVQHVLERLIQARLLRVTEGDISADTQVEVAHEALVRNWPLLVGWLDDDRENIRRRQRLTEAAQQWEALTHDPGALYRGLQLQQAQEWAATNAGELNDLELAFLAASVEQVAAAEREREEARQRELDQAQALAREAEARRKAEAERADQAEKLAAEQQLRALDQAAAAASLRKRAWLATALGIIALLLAVVAGWFAWQSFQNAETANLNAAVARQNAAEARQNEATAKRNAEEASKNLAEARIQKLRADILRLADAARRNSRTSDPAIGLLLSHAASEKAAHLASESLSLTETLSTDISQAQTQALDALIQTLGVGYGGVLLSGHAEVVNSIAFSSDGTKIATGGRDLAVRIWDAASGRWRATGIGHTDVINRVAFAPDGATAATASNDGTARLWDSRTGSQLRRFAEHSGPVMDVAFSPDGALLATVGEDGLAILWNLADGKLVHNLLGQKGGLRAVAFNHQGDQVGAASMGGTATIWDIATGNERFVLGAGTSVTPTTSITADPLGRYWLTGYADGTVVFWDAASGEKVYTVRHGSGAITTIAVSHDDSLVMTASQDGLAMVGLSATKGPPYGFDRVLKSGDYAGASWYERNDRPGVLNLVAFIRDGTVSVWPLDLKGGHFQAGLPNAGPHAFSADGSLLATTSSDGPIEILATLDLKQRKEFTPTTAFSVTALALDADGGRLAALTEDGVLTLWDVDSVANAPVTTTLMATSRPYSASLGFDGDAVLIAASHLTPTLLVWQSALQGLRPLTLPVVDALDRMVISPNGRWVATLNVSGTVQFWPVSRLGSADDRFGARDPVQVVPGAPPLAAQDAVTPSLLAPWIPPEADGVSGIAFAPDDSLAATAYIDNRVRVWDLAHGTGVVDLSLPLPVQAMTFGHPRPGIGWLAVALSQTASVASLVRIYDLNALGSAWLSMPASITAATPDLLHEMSFNPDNTRLIALLGGSAQSFLLDPKQLQTMACVQAGRNLRLDEWEQYRDALGTLYSLSLDDTIICENYPAQQSVIVEYVRRRSAGGELPPEYKLTITNTQELLGGYLALSKEYLQANKVTDAGEILDQALAELTGGPQETYQMAQAYNQICASAKPGAIVAHHREACEKAAAFAIQLDDLILGTQICANARVVNMADAVKPACEHAQELAAETSDTSAVLDLCLLQTPFGDLLAPACARAIVLAQESSAPLRLFSLCQQGLMAAPQHPTVRTVCQRMVDLAPARGEGALETNRQICAAASLPGARELLMPACDRFWALIPKLRAGAHVSHTITLQEPAEAGLWGLDNAAGQSVQIVMLATSPDFFPALEIATYTGTVVISGTNVSSRDVMSGGVSLRMRSATGVTSENDRFTGAYGCFQLAEGERYIVRVTGPTGRLGSYELRVAEAMPTAAAGQPITGDSLWTFAADRGDLFDIALVGVPSEIKEVANPDCIAVGRDQFTYDPAGQEMTMIAPAAGAYYLRVRPPDITRPYTLSLQPVTVATLQPNVPVTATGAITALWSFTGTVGQIVDVVLDSVSASDFSIQLLDGSGAIRATSLGREDGRLVLSKFLLPATDRYLIRPSSLNYGRPYTLTLRTFALADLPVVMPGTSVTGTTILTPLWVFAGRAGQVMSATVESASAPPTTLYAVFKDAHGASLSMPSDSRQSGPTQVLLPDDGIYLAQIRPNDWSMPYTLTLEVASAQPLTVNTTVSLAGNRIWSFPGQAGQVMRISTERVVPPAFIEFSITAPNGRGIVTNTQEFLGRLTATGHFTIVTGLLPSGTQSSTLRLSAITTTIKGIDTGSIVTGVLEAGETTSWSNTPSITSGLLVTVSDVGTPVRLSLFGPDGQWLRSVVARPGGGPVVLFGDLPKSGPSLLALENMSQEEASPYRLALAATQTTVIPDECIVSASAVDYGPVKAGSQVIVGRFRVVNGGDNWNSLMDSYVGRRATVVSLRDRDPYGCPTIALDIDNGAWSWRIRDLFLVPSPPPPS